MFVLHQFLLLFLLSSSSFSTSDFHFSNLKQHLP
ncbi:hypothetical protein CsSME_00019819 [Camellia sinensis var. sinensis]